MDLLPIGRFGRITGLSVRALRHYDQLGLLTPAHVEDETGYGFVPVKVARRGLKKYPQRFLRRVSNQLGVPVAAADLGEAPEEA